MSIRSVDSIERSVHKTNEWLTELCAELRTEDREEAWRVTRAYLQTVRDRLKPAARSGWRLDRRRCR